VGRRATFDPDAQATAAGLKRERLDLGHVTAEELRRRLDATEIATAWEIDSCSSGSNGASAFRTAAVFPLDELEATRRPRRDAIDRARKLGVLNRSPEAERRWTEIYYGLDDDVDGVVGLLTARAEAQMLRLSVAYALLDGSATIEVAHLDAAKLCGSTARRRSTEYLRIGSRIGFYRDSSQR